MEMNSISTNFESLANVSHLDETKSSGQRIISKRMQENGGTVLVDFRRFFTLEFYVSGKKTYFCSHINSFVSIFLCGSIMFVSKSFVHGDDWLFWIGSIDGDDGSFLSMSTVVICRSNTNELSNLPINFLFKSDLIGTSLSCLFHQSPRWNSLRAMHVECTESATYDFVTINWEIWIKQVTMQCESDF